MVNTDVTPKNRVLRMPPWTLCPPGQASSITRLGSDGPDVGCCVLWALHSSATREDELCTPARLGHSWVAERVSQAWWHLALQLHQEEGGHKYSLQVP